MSENLQSLAQRLNPKRDYDSPPLHQWHPELSGDIDILITCDGRWFHEGSVIERSSLVSVFASILRREEDGEYYLVTPVEKWRIQVELHPLLVTDIDRIEEGGEAFLDLTLNTGKRLRISDEHPLSLEPSRSEVAVVSLWHGLTALFSRAAWYRLVEFGVEDAGSLVVASGDYRFEISMS